MANAALAVGVARIKPVPASIQLLEKQLVSGDPGVRDSGLNSITKLKPPVEPLTNLAAKLLEDGNWFVRRAAGAALTRCSELEDCAQIAIHSVAAPRLSHEDHEVRRQAARTLVYVAVLGAGSEAPTAEDFRKNMFIPDMARKDLDPKAEGEEEDDDDDTSVRSEANSFSGHAAPGSIQEVVALLAGE
ncbi:unnamed protein product, partial [Polarella glacialis]